MSHADRLEHVASNVVDCGFELHRDIGPGLLESAYEALLCESLRARGLTVARQVTVPLRYRELIIDNAFKIDRLVEDSLVVELKSCEKLLPVHGKQVLTYLRLMGLPLGLLINFGEAMFKSGVKRVANDYHGGRF